MDICPSSPALRPNNNYTWSFIYNPPAVFGDRMEIDHQSVFTDGSRVGKNNNLVTGIGIAEVNTSGEIRVISSHGGNETDINAIEAKAILKYLSEFDEKNAPLNFVVDSNIIMTRIYNKIIGKYTECRTENSQRIQDIVIEIYNYMVNRPEPITFTHVKSHQGNYGNFIADDAAKKGTLLPKGYTEIEYIEYNSKTKNMDMDIDMQF